MNVHRQTPRPELGSYPTLLSVVQLLGFLLSSASTGNGLGTGQLSTSHFCQVVLARTELFQAGNLCCRPAVRTRC